MRDLILRFLNDLDSELAAKSANERLSLYHIGRSALVWKHGFSSATEDIDVISPRDGINPLMTLATRLFGKGTVKAREHGIYLEEVPPGLPPIWEGCYKRAVEANEKWDIIRLFHLEDHDLAVTKLKRFSLKDQEDIRTMCDLDLLNPETLRERVNAAWFFEHEKDEDPGRESAFASLSIVEKYLLESEWGA